MYHQNCCSACSSCCPYDICCDKVHRNRSCCECLMSHKVECLPCEVSPVIDFKKMYPQKCKTSSKHTKSKPKGKSRLKESNNCPDVMEDTLKKISTRNMKTDKRMCKHSSCAKFSQDDNLKKMVSRHLKDDHDGEKLRQIPSQRISDGHGFYERPSFPDDDDIIQRMSRHVKDCSCCPCAPCMYDKSSYPDVVDDRMTQKSSRHVRDDPSRCEQTSKKDMCETHDEEDQESEIDCEPQKSDCCFFNNTSTKKIQESCADFLSIVHDTVLETVQKSVDCILQDYFSHTMEKMESLCSQTMRNECLLSKMYLDIMDKLTQQSDKNLQQFKCLCHFLIESRNNHLNNKSNINNCSGSNQNCDNKTDNLTSIRSSYADNRGSYGGKTYDGISPVSGRSSANGVYSTSPFGNMNTNSKHTLSEKSKGGKNYGSVRNSAANERSNQYLSTHDAHEQSHRNTGSFYAGTLQANSKKSFEVALSKQFQPAGTSQANIRFSDTNQVSCTSNGSCLDNRRSNNDQKNGYEMALSTQLTRNSDIDFNQCRTNQSRSSGPNIYRDDLREQKISQSKGRRCSEIQRPHINVGIFINSDEAQENLNKPGSTNKVKANLSRTVNSDTNITSKRRLKSREVSSTSLNENLPGRGFSLSRTSTKGAYEVALSQPFKKDETSDNDIIPEENTNCKVKYLDKCPSINANKSGFEVALSKQSKNTNNTDIESNKMVAYEKARQRRADRSRSPQPSIYRDDLRELKISKSKGKRCSEIVHQF